VNNNQFQLDKSKNDLLAWLMATVPIIGIILGMFLPLGGWTFFILNVILGFIDNESLKKQCIIAIPVSIVVWIICFFMMMR